jgi:hypothetical protein
VGRLLVYAALAVLVWRLASGRWPWEGRASTRAQALLRARKLLGVRAGAQRVEIIEAHRRLLVMVHPDRGGTNDQVHEANAARDLLLDELPDA